MTAAKRCRSEAWGVGIAHTTGKGLAIGCLCLNSLNATAAQWTFTPQIAVGLAYADNIRLEPEGQEDSDLVGQVSPKLSVAVKGRRVNGELGYVMQNLFYAQDSDLNDTFHQLEAEATGEVFSDTFFIDVGSEITQTIVDSRSPVPDNNLFSSGNRTDAIAASISPYLRQRFSSFAETELRYLFGVVDFEQESEDPDVDIDDNTQHNVSAVLRSPADDRRLPWLLKYDREQTDFEDDTKDVFQAASLELEYHLTRGLTLLATGGQEDNEFGRGPEDEPDGTFWEAGLRIRPTARDTFELAVGDRFFGDTRRALWAHTGKTFTVNVTFAEEVDSAARRQLDPLQPIDETNDLPVTVGARLTREVFVSRLLSAEASKKFSRSEFTINLFGEEREFQQTLNDETLYGVFSSWVWQLGPRTELLAGLEWQRNESDDPEIFDTDLLDTRLGLAYRFGPKTTVRGEWSYSQRLTDNIAEEFQSNLFTVQVERTL
ncbi:MAG: TIGR03016 family PEP-CTERM system-associated outer membrane protein [Gammaproteobacteria bacterium]